MISENTLAIIFRLQNLDEAKIIGNGFKMYSFKIRIENKDKNVVHMQFWILQVNL